MGRGKILIIGQGIAGSILAHELEKERFSVDIITDPHSHSSSAVAAGLYNPITGRQMVKTWLADEIFPSLANYYNELETILKDKFHHSIPIYRPFLNRNEEAEWRSKSISTEFAPYIEKVWSESKNITGILDEFGGVELKQCGYVEVKKMIGAFLRYYEDKGIVRRELFDHSNVMIEREGVRYRNNIWDKLIFCEGPAVTDNPFWNHLKFKPVKGDVIDLDNTLDSNQIVNRGVFIIPKSDCITVGSSYNHNDLTWKPNENDIQSIMNKLANIFEGNYRILQKRAGIRPATYDRRPFVGFHVDHKNIGIFNGFGTKGVSLVPYFARKLVENILTDKPLDPEVSVER